MPIIQLLIYTDIGKVRVAPKEQTVVIGKGCGELMGGKNLGDLEVVETVVFGKLLRQLGLPQTGVAPAVNGSLIVHCYNVVKAGSDLRDLRLLNLLGNIGDIDYTGNLGFKYLSGYGIASRPYTDSFETGYQCRADTYTERVFLYVCQRGFFGL